MRAALAFAVAACGSTPPPAPPRVVEPKPAWAPARPTCEEAGIILRGPADYGEDTGPAKELEIADACKESRWPQAVIECVASSTNPNECLLKLSPAQHANYEGHVAAYLASLAQGTTSGPPTASCFDALHSIELFDPPITDSSPEPDWEKTIRERDLATSCSTGWRDEARVCLVDAATESDTASCVALLEPTVHTHLLVIRDLARSIATLRNTPAKLTCAKVAEHHYSDAKAKQELKSMKPADRTWLIKGVRKTMSDACTSEGWDEATRACMIADGGEETCFGSVRWGSVKPTVQLYAIPACADYARAVSDFQACSSAPLETRNAMQQALQNVDQSTVGTMTPDDKRRLETACQSSANAVRQVTASYGC